MTFLWTGRGALAAVGVSLLLAGCGSNVSLVQSGSYTVKGDVIAPGALPQALSTQAQNLPAQTLQAANWAAPHVPGQVLVVQDQGSVGAQTLGALSGVRTRRAGENLLVASTPGGQTDGAFAAKLRAAGLRVQPNYLYKALALPNDPGVPGNAGVALGGQQIFQNYLNVIRAPQAWDALQAGQPGALSGVRVGVLDTGFNVKHPDLVSRVFATLDCSVVENGACNGPDLSDSDDHGTGVAGIIGAETNNGLGVAGLTWSGKDLFLVKVFGVAGSGTANSASTVSIAAGIRAAIKQNVRVINMSLGANLSGFTDGAVQSAITDAAAMDILMVAAAGNERQNPVLYPASDPKVIGVGSVLANGQLTDYSARGQGLELVAPGGCGRLGSDCVNSDNTLALSKSGGYTITAGTSEASPMVAGVAVLLRATNPDLSAADTRALLSQTATPVSGGKLVNAEAAVAAALAQLPPPPPAPVPEPTPAKSYTVTVRAFDVNGPVGDPFQETVPSGTKNIPYSLNLPAGDYTVNATISGDGGYSATGERDVTVGGDLSGVDVQTK